MSLSRQLRRIYEVQKSQGNREAFNRAVKQKKISTSKKLHRIRRWIISDWDFLRFRLWKQSLLGGYDAIADPFKTIWISPTEIRYLSSKNRPDQYAVGKIEGGDWDQNCERFVDMYIFKCLSDRFVHGKEWSETKFIQDCLYRHRTWRGCETPREIYNRCRQMDELYKKIDREGFKPTEIMMNGDPKSAIKNGGDITEHLDNIMVDIGRDGQFLFVDGKHRLSIAKILDIDKIPANILVRHKEWQTVREEVAQASSADELNDRTYNYLQHPDIADIVPNTGHQ